MRGRGASVLQGTKSATGAPAAHARVQVSEIDPRAVEAPKPREDETASERCAICGGGLTPRRSGPRASRRLCGSEECRAEDHRRRQRAYYDRAHAGDRSPRPCKGCGVVFTPKHAARKFCTDRCRAKHFGNDVHRKGGTPLERALSAALRELAAAVRALELEPERRARVEGAIAAAEVVLATVPRRGARAR